MASLKIVASALVVAVLAVAQAGQAHADSIDFEDIAIGSGGVDSAGDRSSGGFDFDVSTNHSHRANNDGSAPDNGGTHMIWDDGAGDAVITMDRTDSAAFSLSSVELVQAVSSTGVTVRFTGYMSGGGTVVQEFDLTSGWSAYNFTGAGWGSLTSVTFEAIAGTNNSYYATDNFTVGSPVPEPGSLALLGLGLAAYGARRRRRGLAA